MVKSQKIEERTTHKGRRKFKRETVLRKSRETFQPNQSLVHSTLNAAAAAAFENGEEISIRLQDNLITLLPDGTYMKESQPRRQNTNRIIELP